MNAEKRNYRKSYFSKHIFWERKKSALIVGSISHFCMSWPSKDCIQSKYYTWFVGKIFLCQIRCQWNSMIPEFMLTIWNSNVCFIYRLYILQWFEKNILLICKYVSENKLVKQFTFVKKTKARSNTVIILYVTQVTYTTYYNIINRLY